MPARTDPDRPPLLLGIDLEDWHQLAGRECGDPGWDVPHPAFEAQVRNLLAVLDDLGARATFFVLGMTARNHPDAVREVARRGHELACHGYGHHPVPSLTREAFAADVLACSRLVEEIGGARPVGYRAPRFSLDRDCVWALEALADLGFEWDSSLHDTPRVGRAMRLPPGGPFPMRLPSGRELFEFPLPVWGAGRARLPIGGGSYWRVLPAPLLQAGLSRLSARGATPVLYFHPYEFSPSPLAVGSYPGERLLDRARGALLALRYNPGRRLVPARLARVARRFHLQTHGQYLASLGQRPRPAALSPAGEFVRPPV